jgi:integration host factor subunit beta
MTYHKPAGCRKPPAAAASSTPPYPDPGEHMATVTKKELIDRIADATGQKRVVVKKVVQSFLDSIIVELGQGNRLEFRDFGVFEVKQRAARTARNPKTMEKVKVAPKRTVKFKVGRTMKLTLAEPEPMQGNPAQLED